MTPVPNSRRALIAYALPFGLFLGGLVLVQAVSWLGARSGNLFLERPEYWIYPAQTMVCGAAVVWFWKRYDFGANRGVGLGVLCGLVALGVWVAPQALLGRPPRLTGFDPTVFSGVPGMYVMVVAARMARLVVVVPLVEEIFWRGFLMRYLIREDFESVAIGAFRPLAFGVVAVLFMAGHAMVDWPAALVTGLLYNGLAVRTGSLTACVIAHSTTNLGLGIYILSTGQWGYW